MSGENMNASILHFDHAGASLLAPAAREALEAHIALEAELGGYEAARLRTAELSSFYSNTATLIGAHPAGIAFAENGSSAWARVVAALPWSSGDRVLLTPYAYGSNYLYLRYLAKHIGIAIDVAPLTRQGTLDLNKLEDALTPQTRLIACPHIPMHRGYALPLAEIGGIAARAGAVFAVDACQSVGQVPIDVSEIGCQILAGTGRKFLQGPRGSAFVYVEPGFAGDLTPVFANSQSSALDGTGNLVWASGATRFETWERSIASQLGLGRSIATVLEANQSERAARIRQSADLLISALSTVDGLTVYEERPATCGLVTFRHRDRSSEAVFNALRSQGVLVSHIRPDQMLLDPKPVDRLRASVHASTTKGDIDRFLEVLEDLLKA